jgi:hypothetical protein
VLVAMANTAFWDIESSEPVHLKLELAISKNATITKRALSIGYMDHMEKAFRGVAMEMFAKVI